MRSSTLAAIAASALVLVFLLFWQDAMPDPAGECRTIYPKDPPQFSISAVWNSPEDLLFADIYSSSFIIYDTSAPFPAASELDLKSEKPFDIDPLKSVSSLGDGNFTPLRIKSDFSGSHWVTSDSPSGDAVLWVLDEGLSFRAAFSLDGFPGAGGGRIAATYDFAPITKMSLLVFADIKRPDGSWGTGFVVATSGLEAGFYAIESLVFEPRNRFKAYYLAGRNMICSNNSGAHALVLYGTPRVISVASNGALGVVELSADLGTSLRVDSPSWDLSSIESNFAGLETVSGPAGIYCSDDAVYLLVRDSQKGGPIWKLARVALEEKRIDASWLLPSTAPDVYIVPGPFKWAVVSKGRPSVSEGEQVQPVEQIDLIPAEVFSRSAPAGIALARSAAFSLTEETCK